MTGPYNGEYVELNGLKTFYIKAGSGHPLVLIHGGSPGACALVSWKKNISYFAESGFLVYAFDEAGFGKTDNPADLSLEYRFSHAKSFIDAMQLGKFHLLGNSQGAYIAARIALEDERAKDLVLVSSGTLAPKGSKTAEEISRRHSEEMDQYQPTVDNLRSLTMGTLFNKHLVEELLEVRYPMSVGKNYEAHVARRGTPRPKPIQDKLKNLRGKTLILWGKNDRGAAVERALLLFELIPNAELHIFDRCAHWIQWDQSARFNRIVVDFLRD